jgi:murein tripeptide amidase MpaA
MLNPDGVSCGNYRLDPDGYNLNRHYKNPSQEKHPTIYAVKTLLELLKDKLAFYFDLHAHGGKKSTFVYGNAHDEFHHQVESQVFAKLLALNCPSFDYDYCNFSPK